MTVKRPASATTDATNILQRMIWNENTVLYTYSAL